MSYLIASYPRSGSTYLRFILCNLFYSHIEHDFDTVNKHIPAIDDYAGMKDSNINEIFFYKTHALRHGQNVIFLHRHVGDVLISEYWYKQKFHAEDKTLHEFLIESNYGANWRESVQHYFPCRISISYDELSNPGILKNKLTFAIPNLPEGLHEAIEKSSFQKMKQAEEKGFGIYETGNKEIKFCRRGTSNQWRELDEQTRNRILERNYIELKALGYKP